MTAGEVTTGSDPRYGPASLAGKGLPKAGALPKREGPGPATRRLRGRIAGTGPGTGPPAPGGASGGGILSQAASGLETVSTARLIRAEIGAKAASTSLSEASCSFAVSARVRSMAVRV